MKPTFKNRPNTVYKINGKEVWESRSTGVCAVVFAIHKDNIFVLAEKRSMNMPDQPGKWVCPSGYIDYDEDGFEAVTREIYEETSFYLNDYKRFLLFDNHKEPFYTYTKPSENRQNIVIWYCMIYDFSGTDLPRNIESYKDSEVDIVKWIPIDYVFSEKYDWAFQHEERIEKAVYKFKKYLES